MMSATLVSAGAASSGYYKAEGYYAADSKEGEQAASWFGRAAETLGLTGRVDDAIFTRMLDGQSFTMQNGRLEPQRLMGRIKDGAREHRPGLDLTFSAPKSVSIAALVYKDERLIEAHDNAAKAAMSHVQDHLVQTRTFVNGQLTVQTGGNIVAGLFRHDTSRLLDPQLHTHAVIANQVYHANGDATAIHNALIFKAQKLGSEIYRNELARSARELGYQVAREGEHRFVVLRDIPTNLVAAFSKRREEIKQSLKDRDIPLNARTAELAALATRAAKHQNVDRTELRLAWWKEAAELGISRDDMYDLVQRQKEKARFHVPGQTRDGVLTPSADAQRSLKTAIAHISENNLHYTSMDLTTAALSFAKHAGYGDVQGAISAALKSGELETVKLAGHDGPMLTDTATLQMEREIGTEFRRGLRAKAVQLPRYASKGHRRNVSGPQALQNRLAYNYAWNEVASPKYPNDRSRKKALRTYSIPEKLNDIAELHDGSTGEDLSLLNMSSLNRLFELRNRFVHFKEMIEFQPFSSAYEVELLLAWDEMLGFQTVSKNAILFLSKRSSLDASFLVGDFETVTVDA